MDLINHITWLIFKFSLSFRLPRIRKKEVLKLRHWKNTSEEVAALSPFFFKFFLFFFYHGPPFRYLFTYLVVTNMQCKEMLRDVHLLTSSTVIYCWYFLFGFVL